MAAAKQAADRLSSSPFPPYRSCYGGPVYHPDGTFYRFSVRIGPIRQQYGYWRFLREASGEDDLRAFNKGFSSPEAVLLATVGSGDKHTDILLCWQPGTLDTFQEPRTGLAPHHVRCIVHERILLNKGIDFNGEVPVYHVDPERKLLRVRSRSRQTLQAQTPQLSHTLAQLLSTDYAGQGRATFISSIQARHSERPRCLQRNMPTDEPSISFNDLHPDIARAGTQKPAPAHTPHNHNDPQRIGPHGSALGLTSIAAKRIIATPTRETSRQKQAMFNERADVSIDLHGRRPTEQTETLQTHRRLPSAFMHQNGQHSSTGGPLSKSSATPKQLVPHGAAPSTASGAPKRKGADHALEPKKMARTAETCRTIHGTVGKADMTPAGRAEKLKQLLEISTLPQDILRPVVPHLAKMDNLKISSRNEASFPPKTNNLARPNKYGRTSTVHAGRAETLPPAHPQGPQNCTSEASAVTSAVPVPARPVAGRSSPDDSCARTRLRASMQQRQAFGPSRVSRLVPHSNHVSPDALPSDYVPPAYQSVSSTPASLVPANSTTASSPAIPIQDRAEASHSTIALTPTIRGRDENTSTYVQDHQPVGRPAKPTLGAFYGQQREEASNRNSTSQKQKPEIGLPSLSSNNVAQRTASDQCEGTSQNDCMSAKKAAALNERQEFRQRIQSHRVPPPPLRAPPKLYRNGQVDSSVTGASGGKLPRMKESIHMPCKGQGILKSGHGLRGGGSDSPEANISTREPSSLSNGYSTPQDHAVHTVTPFIQQEALFGQDDLPTPHDSASSSPNPTMPQGTSFPPADPKLSQESSPLPHASSNPRGIPSYLHGLTEPMSHSHDSSNLPQTASALGDPAELKEARFHPDEFSMSRETDSVTPHESRFYPGNFPMPQRTPFDPFLALERPFILDDHDFAPQDTLASVEVNEVCPCIDCGGTAEHKFDCNIGSIRPLQNPNMLQLRSMADLVERIDPEQWRTHQNPPLTPDPEDPPTQAAGRAEWLRKDESVQNDPLLSALPDGEMVFFWAAKSLQKANGDEGPYAGYKKNFDTVPIFE